MTVVPPPTSEELARLPEAALRQLAELKHGQDELAQAVTRLSARGQDARRPIPSG